MTVAAMMMVEDKVVDSVADVVVVDSVVAEAVAAAVEVRQNGKALLYYPRV